MSAVVAGPFKLTFLIQSYTVEFLIRVIGAGHRWIIAAISHSSVPGQ